MKKILIGIVIGIGLALGANNLHDMWCEGLNETWRYMSE